MQRFRVTWVDDVTMDVEAETGTQAKAIARARRGAKKSDCKIARVAPIAAQQAPPSVSDVPRIEA